MADILKLIQLVRAIILSSTTKGSRYHVSDIPLNTLVVLTCFDSLIDDGDDKWRRSGGLGLRQGRH